MGKNKKFPKLMYVKLANRGDSENEFWEAFDDSEDALEAGETVTVATYELKDVRTGKLLPNFQA